LSAVEGAEEEDIITRSADLNLLARVMTMSYQDIKRPLSEETVPAFGDGWIKTIQLDVCAISVDSVSCGAGGASYRKCCEIS